MNSNRRSRRGGRRNKIIASLSLLLLLAVLPAIAQPPTPSKFNINCFEDPAFTINANPNASWMIEFTYAGEKKIWDKTHNSGTGEAANTAFFGIYDGKANFYSKVLAADPGTEIRFTIDYYEPFTLTASPGAWIEGSQDTPSNRYLHADEIPPARVTDLDSYVERGNVTLTWTAPGDDGDIGRASRYIIKYNTTGELNETNWNTSVEVSCELKPKFAGEKESFTITGLKPGLYHIALRTEDEVPNLSEISNDDPLPLSSKTSKIVPVLTLTIFGLLLLALIVLLIGATRLRMRRR